MWRPISFPDHVPPVLTSWQTAHQPERQASEDIRMSGRAESKGVPAEKSAEVIHQDKSVRASLLREMMTSKLSLYSLEEVMKMAWRLR